MARVPVRIGAGSLRPDLAEAFPWRCREHLAAGEPQCTKRCCGACFFLSPGSGCELGSMRPLRCKTYPLIPLGDRIVLHGRCPDAGHFERALAQKDPRAVALLDVAVAMCDLVARGGDDNSEEVRWMMEYVSDGFPGPTVWRRPKAPRARGRAGA